MPRKKIRARKRSSSRNRTPSLLPTNHPLTPYIEHPVFGIVDRLRSDVIAAINSGDNTLSGGRVRYNKSLASRGFTTKVTVSMWRRWIAALNITTKRAYIATEASGPTQLVQQPQEPEQPHRGWPEPQAAIPAFNVPRPAEGIQPEIPETLFDGMDGSPDRTPVFARAGIGGLNNIPLGSGNIGTEQ